MAMIPLLLLLLLVIIVIIMRALAIPTACCPSHSLPDYEVSNSYEDPEVWWTHGQLRYYVDSV
ncbi:hypothetical protein BJX76DRAFT_342603 [Aspergillus varians]